MDKKYYSKPKASMVRMFLGAILDTHVSGADLPNTGMGGDTDDSTITPEAKGTTWLDDDEDETWQ